MGSAFKSNEFTEQTGAGAPLERVEMLAQHRLHASGYPALRHLTCHLDGRRLVIRGRVPNYYHKQLAQANLVDLGEDVEIVNETQVVC